MAKKNSGSCCMMIEWAMYYYYPSLMLLSSFNKPICWSSMIVSLLGFFCCSLSYILIYSTNFFWWKKLSSCYPHILSSVGFGTSGVITFFLSVHERPTGSLPWGTNLSTQLTNFPLPKEKCGVGGLGFTLLSRIHFSEAIQFKAWVAGKYFDVLITA